jgi:hypothetical protein
MQEFDKEEEFDYQNTRDLSSLTHFLAEEFREDCLSSRALRMAEKVQKVFDSVNTEWCRVVVSSRSRAARARMGRIGVRHDGKDENGFWLGTCLMTLGGVIPLCTHHCHPGSDRDPSLGNRDSESTSE